MARMRRLVSARAIRTLRPGGSQNIVIYQAWADEFVERHSVGVDLRTLPKLELAPTPQAARVPIEQFEGWDRFKSARGM
jgi:hypothetical protein